MGVPRCNLPKYVLEAIKNRKDCNRNIEREKLIQQTYANAIACDDDEIKEICYDENVCDNLKRTICTLAVGDITASLVLNGSGSPIGYKLTAINVVNAIAPVKYYWTFNELIYTIDPSTVANSSEIILLWGGNVFQDTISAEVRVEDANGCSDTIFRALDPCTITSCDNAIEFGNCWEKDGANYLLEVTPTFDCLPVNEPVSTYDINISSNNIAVVQKNNKFYLALNSLQAYKDTNCNIEGRVFWGSGNYEVYEYETNTGLGYVPGLATYRFTFPLFELISGNNVPFTNGVGDIALTQNKAFCLTWFRDQTNTEWSTINRYDIDLNTYTLSNFDQIVEPSGSNYQEGFAVSLEAVSDDLVLVDYYSGAQHGGNFPATQIEIREYNFTTGTHRVVVDYFALYGGSVGVDDIVYYGGEIYVLESDFSGGGIGIRKIKKFNYTTGALISSSSNITITSGAYTTGLAIKDGLIYLYESYGVVRVFDLLFNYLYNQNLDSAPPLGAGIEEVAGAAQIEGGSNPTTTIDLDLSYKICGVDYNKTITVDFPCEKELCCEDCTLDINMTFGNCYEAYVYNGSVSGGIREVTGFTTNGCATVNFLDLDISDAIDNTMLLVPLEIGGKKYIFSSQNYWSSMVVEANYVVCGITKSYSNTFNPAQVNECCPTCNDTGGVTLANISNPCVKDLGSGFFGVEVDFNIICPYADYLGTTLYLGGTTVGTLTTIGGKTYFMFLTGTNLIDICGVPLEAKTTLVVCQDKYTYPAEIITNYIQIDCNLDTCEPCIECTESSAVYEIDVTTLCFSQETVSGDWVAVLPDVFTCNGINYKAKDIKIVGIGTVSGCTYRVEKKNGNWYFVIESGCIATAASVAVEICWDKC